MPLCTLTTTCPSQEISDDSIIDLKNKLADLLERSPDSIKVNVHPDTRMLFNNSMSPASALLEIWSTREYLLEATQAYISALRTLLNSELGIQKERIGIVFHKVKPEQLGLAETS